MRWEEIGRGAEEEGRGMRFRVIGMGRGGGEGSSP